MHYSRLRHVVLPGALFLILLLSAAPGTFASSVSARCPVINSFTPTSGAPGTSITISGCGFTGSTAVAFHGITASFNVNSDTQITATVPVGAISGPIAVTTPGKTVKSRTSFTVIAPPPAITLSQTVGPPTGAVTVSGSNFHSNKAVDVYFDTTDEALVATSGQGTFSISVTVPASAVPGSHWVTAVERYSGLSAQVPFLVQTNWAEYGYNIQHSRTNPYENVLSQANVSALGLDWSDLTNGIVDSAPTVANGVVYVGSNDSNLYAVDAQTGSLLWQATTGNSIESSPAVANGVVYVGSLDDNLYAFNAQTGSLLWQAATGSLIDSSPAVANGVVYVGSFDGNLYAFDATQSGKLLWQVATGGAVSSSPAVANGIVYVGSDGGNLYAFNAQTGKQLWQVATGNAVSSSPAVANRIVYVGSEDGNLYAFNAQTGSLLWQADLSGPVFSSPAVANGVVYVGSEDDNLHAFNAQTGAPLWQGPTRGPVLSSPAVANGVVYVGSFDDSLYAFNAQTGSLLWQAPTGNPIFSPAAVANGVVYVGSRDDNLYAYSLPVMQRVQPPARPRPGTLHPNLNLPLQH